MPMWRTMFSRTTIASSISRPMQSDSAISVRKLSVKPKAMSAMNVAITASGSVRPVMIVLRQLCRNRNTMSDGEQRRPRRSSLDAVDAALDRVGGR